jgi:hypothetical protein
MLKKSPVVSSRKHQPGPTKDDNMSTQNMQTSKLDERQETGIEVWHWLQGPLLPGLPGIPVWPDEYALVATVCSTCVHDAICLTAGDGWRHASVEMHADYGWDYFPGIGGHRFTVPRDTSYGDVLIRLADGGMFTVCPPDSWFNDLV